METDGTFPRFSLYTNSVNGEFALNGLTERPGPSNIEIVDYH
jgi:hypothetical protein